MRLPVYERRAGVNPLSMPQVQANPQISDNGETAAKTLHGVFARLEEIQNGMDDARTLELFNRFKQDSQEYHENPDRGIYNTRFGFQASGLYKDADEWLRRKGEDYARQLPSRRAQSNFRKMAREHIQQRGVQNSRFEAEQVRRYQQETADATIKERLNYAGNHWHDNAAIAQVRQDIQQALELKMRGSGKEAFDAAMADIEDQIGIIRISQALTSNPLDAVRMLQNPDIHLKADTRAKVIQSLKDKTEIYRMHAIVQAYAPHFSPQNAAKAREVLIKRFGEDEGEKAFVALTRHWSVNNYQKQAQEQTKLETQQKNENEILGKWNMYLNGETDIMPDLQELNRRSRNEEISYQFVHGILTQVLNKQKADKAAQAKAEKLKKDIERWTAENRGVFLTNEQMEQAVSSGYWTPEDARHHENTRDEFTRRQEQETRKQEQEENKRLEDNKQNFLERFAEGGVTEEMINDAVKNKILKPSDAKILIEYLRTEQQRLETDQKHNLQEAERLKKKAQEQYQGAVRVVIGMGGRISRESATKLYEADKIDQNFLQWLYGQEEKNEREEAAVKKEQAKLQTKADKIKHERNIEKWGTEIYELYKGEGKGKALEYVDRIEIDDPSTRQKLHARVSTLFDDEAQTVKDNREKLKQAHEDTYSYMVSEILGRSMTNEEIAQKRQEYINMRISRELEENRYNSLIKILDDNKRANDQAAESKRKADNYDIAKDYFDRFSLDGQHEARDTIRKDYQNTRANEIMTLFDRLAQEKQEQQNDQAKAKRLQQDKTFQDLQVKYWREGQTIPNEELATLEQSEGLRADQIAQAHSTNWSMREKKGVAEELAKNPNINFAGMTKEQQEALVSQTMGVSPEQRLENVAMLFRKVLDGTSTNAEIESYRAGGGIHDIDAERLREYEGKFARQQRERLGLYADMLNREIMKLYSGSSDKASDVVKIRNDAMLTFQLSTSTINPHSENFDDKVKEIFEAVFKPIVEQYRNSHKTTTWGWGGEQLTPAGKRVNAAENTSLDMPPVDRRIPITDAWGNTVYMQPDGSLVSGDAQVYMPPAPQQEQPQQTQQGIWGRAKENVMQTINQGAEYIREQAKTFGERVKNAGQNQPNPSWEIPPADNPILGGNELFQSRQSSTPPRDAERLQGVVDVTKSIVNQKNPKITSGFSLKPTALRDGRGHAAVDIGNMPVGTPVHVPNYGASWDVTKTGENKTAGKFIKIQTTLPSGDVHEYTLAHLDSVDVAVGDVVSSADVIAKSGNTGNSTGPHLHVALKVNGQAIDPRSVDVGNYNGISGDTPPQQPIQPQIQQDPYADFWAILRDFSLENSAIFGSGDVLFRSNNLFDTNGRFGGGY